MRTTHDSQIKFINTLYAVLRRQPREVGNHNIGAATYPKLQAMVRKH